jgi:HlyD family secretion protein
MSAIATSETAATQGRPARKRWWSGLWRTNRSGHPKPKATAPSPSISLRELETAPPTNALRITLWTLALLVAVLLVWALTAKLDIVATAPGRLVPQSQVKVVQAAEPGIVREILVRDGDVVQQGQVLVRMDATLAGADATQLAHDVALRDLTVRAIDAALAGSTLAARAGDQPALVSQVSQQFSARLQALRDSVQQEEQAAQRARHDQHAALQVRDKLRATLPSYRQTAESFGKLQREGFVGELMAAEKLREVTEREQDLKAQEATVQAQAAAIAQAESRIVQLRSTFRSQLLSERVQAQAELTRLKQEQTKAGFRSQQLEVRAPQDGVVQGLATYTPGAVLQPGAALLTIVPRGDVLHAEAVIANEDAGFVEVGQRAKVKLAAYPFQKHGLMEGTVIRLSADAEAPEAAAKATGSPYAAPPLAFKAVIALNAQALKLPSGDQLPIAPGMALMAEIHQGRRTVMEYLLSPVQRVGAEAGRER